MCNEYLELATLELGTKCTVLLARCVLENTLSSRDMHWKLQLTKKVGATIFDVPKYKTITRIVSTH